MNFNWMDLISIFCGSLPWFANNYEILVNIIELRNYDYEIDWTVTTQRKQRQELINVKN